ncbi:AbiV family abortive infection protein [Vibrio cholerae]|uniref:AbiV family abortive infection protein n=1 Tax=Vibrio cholerae TaxID=666 RepID=UPI002FDC1C0F|nr:AbiV family abortive infection protein [Vibrio cholerae]
MYSDKQLREMSKKAYDNACELIEDAKILLSNSRYPRAYVLAHLATEEIAKLPIIFGVRVRLKNKDNIDWKHFKSRLNGHQSKLKSIALFDYMNDHVDLINNTDLDLYKRQLSHVKKYDDLKNIGLYSGIYENQVYKPSEQINPALAKAMLQLSLGRLRCLESRWSGMIDSEVPQNGYVFDELLRNFQSSGTNS